MVQAVMSWCLAQQTTLVGRVLSVVVGNVNELMITFTPLSGAARSDSPSPLSYLLQVDDVRILLDCGSPDWAPETDPSAPGQSHDEEPKYPWTDYCETLRQLVIHAIPFKVLHSSDLLHSLKNRLAPTIDLVLLSHGDLAHSGLYPYAYSRWGLKAPAYSTLPVQAMGKIAAMEDVEGIRDEQDIGDELAQGAEHQEMPSEENADTHRESTLKAKTETGKYLATLVEVQDAFEYLNTLRYSQPTHLQGSLSCPYSSSLD